MTELQQEIVVFILVFFRILSMLFMIPLFSLPQISILFKGAFSLLLASLFYDRCPVYGFPPLFISIPREILLGCAIGFMVRLLFASLNMAGEIISLQSGFAFSRFMDPYTMDQTSIFVQLKYLFSMLLFFSIDGHHIILSALYRSFHLLPLGSFSINEGICVYLVKMTGFIFGTALKIGAPVIITLFFIEFSLGMLSRLIPQLNVFIEGIPIKIAASISIFSLSLGFVGPFLAHLFLSLDERITELLRLSV